MIQQIKVKDKSCKSLWHFHTTINNKNKIVFDYFDFEKEKIFLTILEVIFTELGFPDQQVKKLGIAAAEILYTPLSVG